MRRLLFLLLASCQPVSATFSMDGIRTPPDLYVILGQDSGGDAIDAELPRAGGSTFVRTTASTRHNSVDDLLETVSTGTRVVGAPPIGGLLPLNSEPAGHYAGQDQATYVVKNEQLEAAQWTCTGTGCALKNACGTSPAGVDNADYVIDNDGAGTEYITQSVNVGAGANTTAWVWMKHVSGTGQVPRIILDGTAANCPNPSSDWQRCVVEDASASGVSIDLELWPTGPLGSGQRTVCFWRPQVVIHGFQLPWDPVTDAAGTTVNTDELSYTVAGPGSWDTFTVCAWVWRPPGTDVRGSIAVVDGTDDLWFGFGSANAPRFGTYDLADNADVVSDTAITLDEWEHVCMRGRQSSSDVDFFINGSETGLGATTDETWTAGGTYGTTLSVGHDDDDADVDEPLWGFISRLMIWKGHFLSDSEIKNIYDVTKTLEAYE